MVLSYLILHNSTKYKYPITNMHCQNNNAFSRTLEIERRVNLSFEVLLQYSCVKSKELNYEYSKFNTQNTLGFNYNKNIDTSFDLLNLESVH